jgi:protein involved in polysaccharide export with SLBB domain
MPTAAKIADPTFIPRNRTNDSTVLMLLALAAFGAPARAQAEPETIAVANAVLQPGDALGIEIWREPDLSGEFLVNENGTVTLPLLGDRRVIGVPVPVLRDQLISAYREELRNPSISITPLRRVYVLGEVNRPGLHAVDPTVSLAGAVALAGGANPQGDLRRIRVIRGSEEILHGIPVETALTAVDIRSGDQIFIDRRNWFERNSAVLVSSAVGITSIVISLLR